MALITRQAEAHILIGLAPSAVQNFKGQVDLGISHIHSKLALSLPDYNIEVFEATSNRTSIHVFNAFLNFEIAAYTNNQVRYPYLEEKILSIIDNYFEEHTPNVLTTYLGPKLHSDEAKDKCLTILYWLSVINRVNTSINHTTCRLYLNYSTKPELLLKNLKNEALLVASISISEETLTKAIQLILDVQANAFNAGESHIKETTNFKTNSYGAVAAQNLDAEFFYEDKLLVDYITNQTNSLRKIDFSDHIETHEETIWQNFIISFKAGVTSKLTRLNHQIDL